jgi:hypothetical protein
MGNIRGTHSSPGVYTKMTDKKQIITRISLIANKNEDVSNISIGGGSSSKTSVTINGNVVEENGLYYVVLNAKPSVLDNITISMDINDEPKKVTMKKGSDTAKSEEVDKYCKIENVTVEPQSTSVAKYSVNKVVNPNGDGLFNVSVFNVINNEETLILAKQDKYKNTVNITATDIEGYDFINWDNGIESGDTINIEFEMPEHDVVVKCYYNIKTFTITWKNDDDDNTVLTSTTVNYGVKPEYPNENPSKVSTEKYNYTFKGWTPSITEAKEDKTYIAEYLSEIRKYEIIFVNEDGTELLRTDVEYDTMPSYNGTTPTKESTDEFTYSFNGWSPAITIVKGTATYTAQYTSQIRQYNITFIVGDDKVIVPVNYGETPVYPNGTPTKESDAQYTYTFNVWSPEITEVTGNTEYTAVFTRKTNEYNIAFNYKDENGKDVISALTLEYGTKVKEESDKILPPYYETPESGYTFSGWEPEITEEITVEGPAEYIAQYTSQIRSYTIRFLDSEGIVLQSGTTKYGTTPTYNGPVPTKEQTNESTYTFDKWDPELSKVVERDTDYIPIFKEEKRKYNIKFYNSNNEVVQDQNLEYGTTPVGPTVEKESSVEYVYTLIGWNPAITPVTGDVEYYPIFKEEKRKYNTTFKYKNENGIDTTSISPLEYGAKVKEESDKISPKGYETAESGYTLSRWEPEITEETTVKSAETYTAQYNSQTREYKLTVNVTNGEHSVVPKKETYHYNDKVTITITPKEGYEYSPLENIITITGDTTLNYVCEAKNPVENIMIYYGSKLINELDTFNNENITNNLNSFTYDDTITEYGNLTPPFKQPTLNNDAVWEEFYENWDTSIWEENGFVNCILAPNNLTVKLSVDGKNLNTIKQYNKTYTINGIEYNLYIGEPSQPYDSALNGSGAEYTNAIIIITQ